MNDDRLVSISKYLSKHLRHRPERLGLKLAEGGWVEVDVLLAQCRESHFVITRAELDEVVARNDKKRFSFDATGKLIRANQGHSVDIDLRLQPTTPPGVLYHGTNARSLHLIMESGLSKMGRHHVHLSADIGTATKVGSRRGRPVVIQVDAEGMVHAGHSFYLSDNGVWLVEHVPKEFLTVVVD
jgi:putative RNA 2'-phosphotransferase